MENSYLDWFGRLRPEERGDAGECQAGGDGNEFRKLASVHGSILDLQDAGWFFWQLISSNRRATPAR